MGYLMGVPVGSYSLDLGRAHTDFIETKLQRCARRAAPCSQRLVALVSRGRLSCSLSANGHRGPACILCSVGIWLWLTFRSVYHHMRGEYALACWGYDLPLAGGAGRGWAERKTRGDALAVLMACPRRRRLIEGT